ncbi:MAG: tetratricopeptide repeat protein [Synechococcales cyanobacterium C42_A2020_086]|jgi:tetratricopeptide (TPR) repeat protein|nr:tetratricopeptide repeat protein [Synechococcales cyanobacterium C42_A2020_086]
MSEMPSLRDRYLALIDQMVTATLKGQLRSKEQIYQQLAQQVEPGTGEIFERCLGERLTATQTQLDTAADELKQAKASRMLRALQTIQGEWQRYQKEQGTTAILRSASEAILAATDRRLLTWLSWIDPNQRHTLPFEQWSALAQHLESDAAKADAALGQSIQPLVRGIRQGLADCQRLTDSLIRWMYEVPASVGFEAMPAQYGPWKLWSEQVGSVIPQQFFQILASGQSLRQWVTQHPTLGPQDWVELAIVLQYIQRSLVAWFEKQPYDSKWGTKQSVATFLTVAVIWSELFSGFSQSSAAEAEQLAQGSFQAMLQGLRRFSQQPYFPLYGGVFALFSKTQLMEALNYLDEPLQQVQGTQEKARILTLLGYSQRTLGQYDRALAFHQQALETARAAGDQPCEIASLNHLSRTYAVQKNTAEAIRFSQQALILARQTGDRPGEANALTNLGYSEVLAARDGEQLDLDARESAVNYLQQGLQLADKLGDRQSQSLCYNSLGIAHVMLNQPQLAIPYLEKGVQTAQMSGDLYLQGLNCAYLAEAHYSLGTVESAALAAFLGMYLLAQINASEWRQPAGLLTIVQGQLGDERFDQLRRQQRANLIPLIGVDGYDHLPQLLEQYRQSM